MSAGNELPPPPAAPRRFSWWMVLLTASLAVNLLIGGAIGARLFFPPPPERFVGATYAQLVPRHFFGDLDRPRRMELLAVLRQYRKDFSQARKSAAELSAKLADALETDPYDPGKVEAAVQGYADTGNQLVARGTAATLDFISHLTPEERKMMALRLRQRAHMDDHHRSGGPLQGN